MDKINEKNRTMNEKTKINESPLRKLTHHDAINVN